MLFVKQNNNSYEILETDTRIHGDNWLHVPDELKSEFLSALPNVSIAVEGDTVVTVTATVPTESELLAKARTSALGRIEGCCSSAIYAGTYVTPSTARGKHHYSFPTTAQGDINQMMTAIAVNGETVFSYKADDESLNCYTADEIKALSKALKSLCTVCTKYKEEVETWIGRETSTSVLDTIQFGIKLPDDLTKDLTDYLTSLGIDPTPFMSMLK